MAKCKCSKCGSTRIVSNIVQNMPNGCFDVCTNPICGSPDELSILAPLIYDEIGINLCTTFAVGTDISTTYPTATNASVSVIDIAYTYGDENVEITQIAGRPNCYSVKLANLTVTFAITLCDESCRALATLTQRQSTFLTQLLLQLMMKIPIRHLSPLKYSLLTEFPTTRITQLHLFIRLHLTV